MNKKIFVINTLKYQPSAGGVVQYTENIVKAIYQLGSNLMDIEEVPSNRPFLLKGKKYIGVRRVIFDLFVKIFIGRINKNNFLVCTNYLIPFFLNKEEKLRTLVVVHDLQHIFFPSNFSIIKITWLNFSLKRIKNHTGPVVFISESTKNDFIARFGSPINFNVIYNPIYSADSKFLIKSEKNYLLCASHYYPHKNFISVIDLFCKMCERGYDGNLSVTGHGGNVALKNYINGNKNLEKYVNRIKFLGFLDRGDLINKMQNCDALISLSRFEGFNMPAAEAAKMRVKIILSDIPVHKELYGNYAEFVNCDVSDEDVDKCLDYIKIADWHKPWSGDYLCSPDYVAKKFIKLMEFDF